MLENKDMLMDWGDSIENDGQEFVLLPEGDYNFIVTNFERGRFPGGPKVPACNKATITVQVQGEEGIATVKFDLLLYRSLEWRISAFFRCIGQKKHGEKLVMDWNKVVGSVGRAHFKQRTYTNQYGEDKVVNDLDRFIDYNPDFFTIDDDSLPF
jgi:hypothetical protein